MPLFKQNSREVTPPPQEDRHSSRSGLFGRRQRSISPDRTNKSHRSSDSDTISRAGSTRSGGLFGGRFGNGFPHNDPTIMSAREKVSDAEESEKAADRALQAARASVKAAKDHVKFLEKEAEDDAHRARLKQAEAKVVSKSARGLGRHG
ncbi:hypothetical protein D9757_008242 [Collybiopsis confluens]|uniref:Uncharacterized protein n=1 Tax=Collybiopsis confluens TaxID=2823264 RepID=A0A8H5HB01_9AGAR|nr:hypothetical protein D9757_008242 [Collybiopsis confluens]